MVIEDHTSIDGKLSLTDQLISTITGIAPIIVASSVMVAGLNADLLDGYHASAFAQAVHTHAAGDITSGTLAIGRIPTGTTATTVSLGNHTHALLTRGNGLTGSNYNGGAATTWAVQFGTTVGTAAQGNDSRIINGQTAFSWGNHALAGYLTSGDVNGRFYGISATDSSLIDTVSTPVTAQSIYGSKVIFASNITNSPASSIDGISRTAMATDFKLQEIISWGDNWFFHVGEGGYNGEYDNWYQVSTRQWTNDTFYTQSQSDSRFAALSHSHSAAEITSGTLNISRIPTGTSGTTVALGNHTHAFSAITGKPTTLGGYGITDAYTIAQSNAAYAAISHAHTFASLTSKPTTIAGYGITDVLSDTTEITINGTTQALTGNPTWSVGTVKSVGLSMPTGFSVTGSPVDNTGTLYVGFDAGYSLPTTAKQAQWDEAYSYSQAGHLPITNVSTGGLIESVTGSANRNVSGILHGTWDSGTPSDTSNIGTLFTMMPNGGFLGSQLYFALGDSLYFRSSVSGTWLGWNKFASTSWVNSQGFLTNSDVWGIYQPLDPDLTDIAALSGTSGFLRKVAANTWELDTNSYSLTSHTHTFASLTSKPTTIAGYGITDAFTEAQADVKYALVSHVHSASNITSGTLAIDRIPTGTTASTVSLGNHTHTFASLTSKPTTLAGYGITDAFTQTIADGRYALVSHVHSAADITSGTFAIARIPTGTTGITVALGNHTHAQITIGTGLTGTNYNGSSASTIAVNFGTASGTVAQGNDIRILNGQTAFGWGDHSLQGYLKNADVSGVYQPLDADLTSIAGLSGTSGLLRKTAVNTWSLDTNSYSLTSHTHAFSEITGKPTTITGYGITDAFTKAQADLLYSVLGHTHTFESLTGKPTTISGYSISDAYTKTQVDNLLTGYSSSSHTHTFASLTAKPTTVAGYGITDTYTKTESDDRFINSSASNLGWNAIIAAKSRLNFSSTDGPSGVSVWHGLWVAQTASYGTAIAFRNGAMSIRSVENGVIGNWIPIANQNWATPNTRNIIAGNGLTGGGSLTEDRTITLGTPSAITLASTNSVTGTTHTHAFTPGGTTSQYIRGDGSLAVFPAIPAGTVTSIGMTVPAGFAVSPALISTSGTFAVTFAAGYSLPTSAKQTQWDTAYSWGNHAAENYVKKWDTWAGNLDVGAARSTAAVAGGLYIQYASNLNYSASTFYSSSGRAFGFAIGLNQVLTNVSPWSGNTMFTQNGSSSDFSRRGAVYGFTQNGGHYIWAVSELFSGLSGDGSAATIQELLRLNVSAMTVQVPVAAPNLYTKTEVDNLLSGYSLSGHTHTFASLTSKPTTLSGYGITDAFTQVLADARYSLLGHTHAVLTAGTGLTGTAYNGSTAYTWSINFGTAAGTVAQGNDSRILNGQTAFSWGNHALVGYAAVDWVESQGFAKLPINGVDWLTVDVANPGTLKLNVSTTNAPSAAAHHGLWIPHNSTNTYGTAIAFRNGSASIKSKENGVWNSTWNPLITQSILNGRVLTINGTGYNLGSSQVINVGDVNASGSKTEGALTMWNAGGQLVSSSIIVSGNTYTLGPANSNAKTIKFNYGSNEVGFQISNWSAIANMGPHAAIYTGGNGTPDGYGRLALVARPTDDTNGRIDFRVGADRKIGMWVNYTGDVVTPYRFISTIATGTAPFQITSQTAVTNLNADLLDGLHATDFLQVASANAFVYRANWGGMDANTMYTQSGWWANNDASPSGSNFPINQAGIFEFIRNPLGSNSGVQEHTIVGGNSTNRGRKFWRTVHSGAFSDWKEYLSVEHAGVTFGKIAETNLWTGYSNIFTPSLFAGNYDVANSIQIVYRTGDILEGTSIKGVDSEGNESFKLRSGDAEFQLTLEKGQIRTPTGDSFKWDSAYSVTQNLAASVSPPRFHEVGVQYIPKNQAFEINLDMGNYLFSSDNLSDLVLQIADNYYADKGLAAHRPGGLGIQLTGNMSITIPENYTPIIITVMNVTNGRQTDIPIHIATIEFTSTIPAWVEDVALTYMLSSHEATMYFNTTRDVESRVLAISGPHPSGADHDNQPWNSDVWNSGSTQWVPTGFTELARYNPTSAQMGTGGLQPDTEYMLQFREPTNPLIIYEVRFKTPSANQLTPTTILEEGGSLPACIAGPTLLSISNVTQTGLTWSFHGNGVTHIPWEIKSGATVVRQGNVYPTAATINISYDILQPGNYVLEIQGGNCSSPISSLAFTITGGQATSYYLQLIRDGALHSVQWNGGSFPTPNTNFDVALVKPSNPNYGYFWWFWEGKNGNTWEQIKWFESGGSAWLSGGLTTANAAQETSLVPDDGLGNPRTLYLYQSEDVFTATKRSVTDPAEFRVIIKTYSGDNNTTPEISNQTVNIQTSSGGDIPVDSLAYNQEIVLSPNTLAHAKFGTGRKSHISINNAGEISDNYPDNYNGSQRRLEVDGNWQNAYYIINGHWYTDLVGLNLDDGEYTIIKLYAPANTVPGTAAIDANPAILESKLTQDAVMQTEIKIKRTV